LYCYFVDPNNKIELIYREQQASCIKENYSKKSSFAANYY